MAGATVTVPGIGPMDKRVVYGTAGIAGAYAGYRWWRAKSSPAAAPGTDALASDPSLATPGVGGAGGDYVNPAPGRLGGGGGGGSTAGSAPATDQAWVAAVTQDLINLGYNPQAVGEALAAYLASQPLTADQVTIVRLAWAWEGRPPGHPALGIIPGATAPTPTPTPDPPAPDPTTAPPPPAPAPTPAPPPPPPPPPPAPAPVVHRYPELMTWHTNVSGDNYSSIAQRYGTGLSGEQLYQYQFSAEAGRPAATKATLEARKMTIYAGGSTAIPYPR